MKTDKKFTSCFTITRKILANLTNIAAAREIILHAYLVPKWEVTLRKEALIRTAHSSTSIEGNRLSLEQVSELALGRKVMAGRKDKQEVLNYLYVLEHLKGFTEHGLITEKSILNLHKRITKDVLDNPRDSGAYRNRQVYVGNRLTGEIVFMPPKTKDVKGLMQALVEWLNSEDAEDLDQVLVAGVTHYEFVRIHPFTDGNGRTSRALASLILLLRGFDIKRFFTLDDYYDSDRPAYYTALRTVNPKEHDLTRWLEYFTEGVKLSVDNVKEKILRLSSEKLRKDRKGQIALTERQMKIIELLNQKGSITNREIRSMFKLSNRGAMDEIKKLLNLDVIKTEGKGRSTHYVLI
ncbi:MAG: Fic family protein [Thermoplasmatales archaeon]|nr:Fic family protein [Candidatus Thermoplasmatota archaeon]MBU4256726.1 Fic family protein [Candidatus Thermoplasmatota archaeon]MCG2824996.1 Fic family protein [Thermoplasmatales archaeon]